MVVVVLVADHTLTDLVVADRTGADLVVADRTGAALVVVDRTWAAEAAGAAALQVARQVVQEVWPAHAKEQGLQFL